MSGFRGSPPSCGSPPSLRRRACRGAALERRCEDRPSPRQAVMAVQAYQILPASLGEFVGYALPLLELAHRRRAAASAWPPGSRAVACRRPDDRLRRRCRLGLGPWPVDRLRLLRWRGSGAGGGGQLPSRCCCATWASRRWRRGWWSSRRAGGPWTAAAGPARGTLGSTTSGTTKQNRSTGATGSADDERYWDGHAGGRARRRRTQRSQSSDERRQGKPGPRTRHRQRGRAGQAGGKQGAASAAPATGSPPSAQQQAKADSRKRAGSTSSSCVVVVAGGGADHRLRLVGVAGRGPDGRRAPGAGRGARRRVSSSATVRSTLALWEDFQCPGCKSFEEANAELVQRARRRR